MTKTALNERIFAATAMFGTVLASACGALYAIDVVSIDLIVPANMVGGLNPAILNLLPGVAHCLTI